MPDPDAIIWRGQHLPIDADSDADIAYGLTETEDETGIYIAVSRTEWPWSACIVVFELSGEGSSDESAEAALEAALLDLTKTRDEIDAWLATSLTPAPESSDITACRVKAHRAFVKVDRARRGLKALVKLIDERIESAPAGEEAGSDG